MGWHKILVATLILFSFYLFSNAVEVTYDGRALKIDGERKLIISGAIHYPRSTPEMWPSLMKKAKEGGLNAIETYVFWNAHEPLYRQYDFEGSLDLVKYLQTIQDAGLYAILRIGPYVCAEWNYGGLPVWLKSIPNMVFRTKNDAYMNEMKIFTTMIVDKMKDENLFANQGGPIIISQIENEYGNVIGKYGADGKSYVNWCANFAESLNVGVPWIMCQEDDAPSPMINTCNGYYCDQFTPNNNNVPKIWTENWTGWYKGWGDKNPHRTAEDVAFAVGRFYQYGGTVQNYYMYHGGTNFGRVSGGPYIATTYDYDAPLNEYGEPNQPKYGHLKELHSHLMSIEKILTYGNVTNKDYGNMMSHTIYNYDGTRVCFFGNANQNDAITINFEGTNYTVPAWSVSILPDCKTEVYNTARVSTQTSVMVKKLPDEAQEKSHYNLEWSWRVEKFEHLKAHPLKGVTSANQLLDQKLVTNDTSDYLWYMTSFEIDEDDPVCCEDINLQVQNSGHILHAFVNGKHIGTKYAQGGSYSFWFERAATIKKGINQISLLSVTVGLQNYGDHYDNTQNGIIGPVKIIAPNSQEKDLTNNRWAFKVGLTGFERELFSENGKKRKWHPNIPLNRKFVWYKTTFRTPRGEEPVVLDLWGLGKGTAWVNGHDIGRYWPSIIADNNGCSTSCDYRGSYYSSKCTTGCGQPTQRWYHVPRSFLRNEENDLVLFEEFGGDPRNVSVNTVTVGQAIGHAYEGNCLNLSCNGGRVISDIKFASFGDPRKVYGILRKGSCHSPKSLSMVERACVGKESCSIDVSEQTFGPSGCRSSVKRKRLAVEAVC
ncbi:unnamed protein product [Fraxinus pennsylvanica]|uniref:Beta-galactosidase n=1 Tax=Fraxinus pennsylvanica TaxID=56036 RepID=A0AAD1Z0W8_9LAMI|nr:unnamed protein product [Fraxinus pennsylvanica]